MSIPNIRQNRLKRHFSPQIVLKIFQFRNFPSIRTPFRPILSAQTTSKTHSVFQSNNIEKPSVLNQNDIKKTAILNRNDIKKPDLFGSGCLWLRSRDLFNSKRRGTRQAKRQPGGDRVRQHRCPVHSTEIPQNDIKKPDLFGSGCLWRRSRDLNPGYDSLVLLP